MKPEKLLQVTTDYFCAGAVWQKIYGIWSCTSSAPILPLDGRHELRTGQGRAPEDGR